MMKNAAETKTGKQRTNAVKATCTPPDVWVTVMPRTVSVSPTNSDTIQRGVKDRPLSRFKLPAPASSPLFPAMPSTESLEDCLFKSGRLSLELELTCIVTHDVDIVLREPP